MKRLLVILFLFTSLSLPQVINVPNDQPTIQAGMDVASPGDTVLVADGTYTGNGNVFLSFGGKAIVVKSANGPENCIIDCVTGTGVQAFLITNGEGEGSVVDGFKIINGCWVVFCENSKPTIKNNIMDGNNSGVYTRYGDGTIIENNTILNSNENGIYCLSSSPIIMNNTIIGSNWEGIYCRSSYTPIIESNNISESEFNGIKCYKSSPEIKSNTIQNNKGSGIYIDNSSPAVIGNRIFNNGIQNSFSNSRLTEFDSHQKPYKEWVGTTLNGTGNYGGVLIIENSSPVIKNNIIAKNKALQVAGISCDSTSSATIVNNTIVDNTSLRSAVYTESSSVEFINNIISSSNSNENLLGRSLDRWYMNSLLWIFNYEGIKLRSITYYFGFINKGEPGEVTITAFGREDMTFTVFTGERYWLEVTSSVDDWGEGGSINIDITLRNETLSYSNDANQGGMRYYSDFTYSSQGLSSESSGASAIVAIGNSQIPTPKIEYNDFFENQGSLYLTALKDDPYLTIIPLSGINGNISLNPFIEAPNYQLSEISPCIDAGCPDESFNDSSVPPGMGTVRSDIGAYGGSSNSIITDMEDDILININNFVDTYKLYQNYPNPFNPSTTIKYSIPNQSNVTLKIFDVLGSEVTTLVKKEQPQGNNEIEFDGSVLTSGIYFYRIQAGDFVDTKKMILLK